MVNKTNFRLGVLILRSYFNTAEHFTLSNRVFTTAKRSLSELFNLGTFQNVVREI